MEEFKKPDCPSIDVDGVINKGKQFDLDITLPEDHRNVIYGIVKDCFKDPVQDAVVKLVEVDFEKGEKVRKPVSHTFTNEYGEFVFGPLCPDRKYAIDVWVNKVRTIKVCAKADRKGKCLKGVKVDACDKFIGNRPPCVEPRCAEDVVDAVVAEEC